jgi:hypothetical protein
MPTKIIIAGLFGYITSQATELEKNLFLTCTTEQRYYCAEIVGCTTNSDPYPTVFKIKKNTASTISIQPEINQKPMMAWIAAKNDTAKGNAFLESNGTTLFFFTRDWRRFQYSHSSGIDLYDSNLELGKSNRTAEIGGQIYVGSCVGKTQ